MQRNPDHLAAVGPLNELGFPRWYRDSNDVLLELGLDLDDPNLPAVGELPTPGAAMSFPDNFPDEAFYFLAEARLPTGGTAVAGRARVILALEAAFGGDGKPKPGMQAVFGRIRFRIDGAVPNATYVFTHPYGQSPEYKADEGGRLFETEDITLAPGDFEAALGSQIGPFLRWTPDPALAPGYLGDGTTPHRVTGSPITPSQNFVIIESTGIGSLDVDGGPTRDPKDPTNADKVYTELFTVQGRLARVTGVRIDRAVYHRPAAAGGGGPTTVDVLASTELGQQLVLKGPGIAETALRDQQRLYLTRATVAGDPPAAITVTNTTDRPPTVATEPLRDLVTASARYDIDTQTLTVEAASSDKAAAPALTAEGYGPLTAGQPTDFTGIAAVAPTITVTSARLGRAEVPVAITGGALPPLPVTADAGPDQTVEEGLPVTLDGTGSRGAITTRSWAQIGGPPHVVLTGATTDRPSFTAPAAGSAIMVRLTVSGPGGTAADTVTVTTTALNPPTANAGPDQIAVVGDTVTLDGSASLGAAAFAWAQIAGPDAGPIAAADTARPSFTMPAGAGAVVFRLTVSGPGGPTHTDLVAVTARPDTLVVDRAQYRRGGRQWRVSGRASGQLPDEVTVSLNGKEIGKSPVDATGAWDLRVTAPAGSTDPEPTAGSVVTVVSTRGGSTTGTVVVRS